MNVHFDNCGQGFWEVIEKLRDDMYEDDFVTGAVNEFKKSKSDSISLPCKMALSCISSIPTKQY